MKAPCLLLVLLPFFLVACATDRERADYAAVGRSGVSLAIYDKMVHNDDLSVNDIIAMSQARVRDDITIRYIRDQDTIYILSREDIERMQKAGVSASIIDYMVQTERRYHANNSPDVTVGIGIDPWWGGGYYGGGYHHRHY